MKFSFCRRTAGFSLVEVTLALGVAGFCLVALLGLLPVALNSNRAAIEQTAANGILSAIIADLRATPPTAPRGVAATSQQYSIPIPANGSPGTNTIFFNSDRQVVATAPLGRYLLTIAFLPPPGGSGARAATMMDLKVTWPAAAAATNAAGSVETFVALDRN